VDELLPAGKSTCFAHGLYCCTAVNVTCNAIVAGVTVGSCWGNVGRAKGQVAGVPSAFNFVSFADAWVRVSARGPTTRPLASSF
jgi:hypothetical protein